MMTQKEFNKNGFAFLKQLRRESQKPTSEPESAKNFTSGINRM